MSDKLIASLKFYNDQKSINFNGDFMVGIYVRVSTEEQALNGFSIRAQIEKLTAYCTIKEWDIYDVYKDDGISGKNIKDRKELLRLIDDIKQKKVNNILVYKIDRLTRSTKDLIELVDFFNLNNCSFNSFTENIDTLSSTGRMFIKIIGIFAEFERENISERVRFGLERKVKEGYSIASKNVSYGYYKEKNNKIQKIDEYQAYIVRKIFNLYYYGYSLSHIANYLNKYKTKKNNREWNCKNIKLILTNPNYIGLVRYGINKKNYFEIKGKHKKILSENIFYLINRSLNKEKKFYCSCGRKYLVKENKYYSKKEKKYTKYKKIYCSKCKKCFSLNKIYEILKNEDILGKKIVVDSYQSINFQ